MAITYMTKEGYKKKMEEIAYLESVKRPEISAAIAEARDKGDLSENFEYHAAKREQGKLLGKIRFKQRVLQFARVMDTTGLDNATVGLFRKVTLTNLATGTKMEYTIVNPHEANLKEGKISIKSPIAHALVGRTPGEEVEVKVPAGTMKLRIDSINI